MRNVMMRVAVALLGVLALADPAVSAIHRGGNGDDAFKAANESGRLVLVIYSVPSPSWYTQRHRDYMLRVVREASNFAAGLEVADAEIIKDDGRYKEYRGKMGGQWLPLWAIAKPDGEFIMGGDGETVKQGNIPSSWWARVNDLLKKYLPNGPKEREAAEKLLAEGRDAVAMGDYPLAQDKAAKVAKTMWWTKAIPEEAKRILREIDERGQRQLEVADRLVSDQQCIEAAYAYRCISEDFTAKLPAGQEAQKKLGAVLAADRKVALEFSKNGDCKCAEALLARGKELEDAGKNDLARKVYMRIVAKFAKMPCAAVASAAIKKLAATPKTNTK